MDFGEKNGLFEFNTFYIIQALVSLSNTDKNRTGCPTDSPFIKEKKIL
jgi:hypothetical protein